VDLYNAVILAAAVLAVPFTAYPAYGTWQQRRRPHLLWSRWTKPELRGEEARATSTSRVRMWNAGGARVDWADRAPSDVPRIVVSSGPLSAATVTARTAQYTGFRVEPPAGDSVEILFDYLEPRDGGVVEVEHASGSTIRYAGSFRGVPRATEILVDFLGREHPDPRRRSLEMWAEWSSNATRLASPFFGYFVIGPTVSPSFHTAFTVLCAVVLCSATFGVTVHRRLWPPVPSALRLPAPGDLP
jgi:hypothetical protein